MTATLTENLSVRDQLKQKLAELDLERQSISAALPSPFLKFFRFRLSRPRTKVMIYAADADEARDKCITRLDREYGPGEYQLHNKIDVYTDPEQANGDAAISSTVFECLTREDANLFLSHCDEAQSVPSSPAFKSMNPGKPGSRKQRKSGLEKAADEYRFC